ncbi:30S ribosomal protein S1 [Candidatus Falkowbacteria bacterium HGW-Falkowbacteria-1]|uniref:30S ribosomal protein S1 n=1 Tax=Candidatus Falkowbacteria bacterium HGW-Falkowbacteria-1 TaxID=2013768 RepID=A0A2N2E8I9_9BACT|nr:MAG: 30S ribosomal protein S1 [Candidatus Falkowbacteria bacterium HGW-Falkowbacteria-1]
MNINEENNSLLASLLEKDEIKIPKTGDTVIGKIISASKSEVRIDIDGVFTGIVRGPELYFDDDEFDSLKPGAEVEATVIDEENEMGELELSFRQAGQEKAWAKLEQALKDKELIKVKVLDANKGGLLVKHNQITGFLPVSQLSPENYPRVSGGDKQKILEKLKSFVGNEMEVNVINLGEESDKIIFSEKDVWNKKQKHIIDKYKLGMVVDGKISAVTNFGVFISFGEGMEGLVHISELAWQRIDSLDKMYKVGDEIRAEIVNLDNNKIFLSAKKIVEDPWKKAVEKYSIGQIVKGIVLKINPFGLFVKLDDEIHGLAHVTQLGANSKDKIAEMFKIGEEKEFEIISISPSDHRLGLKLVDGKKTKKKKEDDDVEEKKEEKEEEAEIKKVEKIEKEDNTEKIEETKEEKANKKVAKK